MVPVCKLRRACWASALTFASPENLWMAQVARWLRSHGTFCIKTPAHCNTWLGKHALKRIC